MRIGITVSMCFVVVACGGDQSDPTTPATELLERSIQYHDPDGTWSQFAQTLVFEESRPDGSTRVASVELDVPRNTFRWKAIVDGRTVVKRSEGGDCQATIDGSSDYSSELAEQHRLACPEILRSHNYYLFLWGLPMKLRDPGTRIDPEAQPVVFDGQSVEAIKVTYDPDVGTDTWYFYFEPATARLVGYRFYHDEAVNDGEYITLEGEYVLNEMRLPQTRGWYRNDNDQFLGNDRLTTHQAPASRERD